MRHKVVALLSPPVSLFEFAIVVEVFALPRENMPADWYEFRACAVDRRSLGLSATDVVLDGLAGAAALDEADTIIVPSHPLDAPAHPAAVAALRQAAARGARILSICSGAFLLAEAGLLDGRRATTHWMYVEELQRRRPQVRVEPDVLFVEDGGLVTAAGSAAGIDLLLHVVRRDHGVIVSNTIARRMNVAPLRDGAQAQFIPRPVPPAGDAPISRVIAWMRENCREPLSVRELAARAPMSVRSFQRHFKLTTGLSPGEWLIRERVRLAADILDTTSHRLARVAEYSGFSSPELLRVHFHRLMGQTPTAYRRASRDRPALYLGAATDPQPLRPAA